MFVYGMMCSYMGVCSYTGWGVSIPDGVLVYEMGC